MGSLDHLDLQEQYRDQEYSQLVLRDQQPDAKIHLRVPQQGARDVHPVAKYPHIGHQCSHNIRVEIQLRNAPSIAVDLLLLNRVSRGRPQKGGVGLVENHISREIVCKPR